MPIVSIISRVLGISKTAFAPAEITIIGIFARAIKSWDISKEYSTPRWTPPMPPVANTRMPTWEAMCNVDETVVAPFHFLETAIPSSLRDTFFTDSCCAINANSSAFKPARILPLRMAITAGTTLCFRQNSSIFWANSRLSG